MPALLDLPEALLWHVLDSLCARALGRLLSTSIGWRDAVVAALHLRADRLHASPLTNAHAAAWWLLREHLAGCRRTRTVSAAQDATVCITPHLGRLCVWGGRRANEPDSSDDKRGTAYLGLGPGQAPTIVRAPIEMAGSFNTAASWYGYRLDVCEVSMSHASTLLRTQHGTVLWCGVNVFDETQHIPARLPQIDDVKVVQIATGGWYSLLLDDAGRVYSFGESSLGELGHGGERKWRQVRHPLPIKALDQESVRHISAANSHAHAVTADGQLWSWGGNSKGELGQGPIDREQRARLTREFMYTDPNGYRPPEWHDSGGLFRWQPVRVSVPGVRFVETSGGSSHTLALTSCGRVFSCGCGRNGALGQGYSNVNDPCWRLREVLLPQLTDETAQRLKVPQLRITLRSMGRDHTGNKAALQARLLNALQHPKWAALRLARLPKLRQVAAGGSHSVVLTQDGQVFQFGSIDCGRRSQPSFWPVRICRGLQRVRVDEVSTSGRHVVVRLDDGSVCSMGCNDAGQLGINSSAKWIPHMQRISFETERP